MTVPFAILGHAIVKYRDAKTGSRIQLEDALRSCICSGGLLRRRFWLQTIRQSRRCS